MSHAGAVDPQGVKPVTRDEMTDILAGHRQAQEQAAVAGVKYFRMPRLYATPSGGTVVLGETWAGQPYTGQTTGPNSGYVWSIRRLTANGLGTGSNPDILNIYRNGVHSDPVWQLNGNNWGYSFGPTELLLMPGEKLLAMSLGSLVSTAQITLTGDAIEVPQAMIGKLVV
jgi:hypothetical protein